MKETVRIDENIVPFQLANQSLLEQILADYIQQEQIPFDAENWFEAIITSVNNLFSLLYDLYFSCLIF